MSADRVEILSADELGRTLNRLASQVLESVADSRQLVLVGIPTRGVALAEVLQRAGAALWIKWPNDLYRIEQGLPHKVGGILTEVKALGAGRHRVVSGFCLNLFAPPQALSPSASNPTPAPAGALFAPQARARIDRERLAQDLADAVAEVMLRYPTEGLTPWFEAWSRLDLLAGRAITVHHPAGTCRMGPASDAMAVTDSVGRVHGLQHLRVIDASLMPDLPSGNINAPTIMMAEKIADHLRGRAALAAQGPGSAQSAHNAFAPPH